jgi:hypothetical protein
MSRTSVARQTENCSDRGRQAVAGTTSSDEEKKKTTSNRIMCGSEIHGAKTVPHGNGLDSNGLEDRGTTDAE